MPMSYLRTFSLIIVEGVKLQYGTQSFVQGAERRSASGAVVKLVDIRKLPCICSINFSHNNGQSTQKCHKSYVHQVTCEWKGEFLHSVGMKVFTK